MGVLTEHVGSRFFLAKKDEKKALLAMKELVAESGKATDYVLDPKRLAGAKDMVAALRSAGFVAERNAKGDLVGLRWGADKLPYDTETLRRLLTSFAAYVKKGSWL